MTTRSIVLHGLLVRAALAGRVTEIRVPMKPQPAHGAEWDNAMGCALHLDYWGNAIGTHASPLGIAGDRLAVREAWAAADIIYGDEKDVPQVIAYRADKSARVFAWGGKSSSAVPDYDLATWGWGKLRWRSATQMPLWASRLAFDVLGSRCERLLDIAEDGAIASGVDPFFTRFASIGREQRLTTGELCADAEHRASYAVLWDERFGDVTPWKSNPHVWVAKVRLA